MATRTFSRRQIIALAISGGVASIAVIAWLFSLVLGGTGVNPFLGAASFVYPGSSAASAAATASGSESDAFTRIARTPTAIWLTPEQHDTADVTAFVDDIATKADAAGQLPVFTVYGIPDRDCSNQSAGGTAADDYPAWVSAVAAGLAGHTTVVILEPDSLALTEQCGDADTRVAQIGGAVDLLVSDETFIYLDGGHSTWLSAETQATLLNRAGIEKVRGFATNVSNFNDTAAEVAYGREISSLTGGSHFVIDTGRNGNGGTTEWCNPSGRALGAEPEAVDDGTAHDANLWIKNPGESDGECNGGPAAGTWWPAGALALANS